MVNELLLRDASQARVEWGLQISCLRQGLIGGLGLRAAQAQGASGGGE